jgi:4-amino-4-deoxy-L-arabinose transferase-like glycosyltransferase
LQLSTLAKRAWLLFFLAAALFYLYGLDLIAFVGPDEPRYAQVAREMFLRGDLLTPTLGGHTWFEKPVLLYWMLTGSFKAFGVSEWAARLPLACAGLLSVFLIYWIGRRVEGASREQEAQWLGLASAIVLATSAGLMAFSRGVNFDVVLTATMTGALACFWVQETGEEKRGRGWLLAGFYTCVGASLLAKGLVGMLLPFSIITAYYALRREWPDRRLMRSLLWGIPLMLMLAALWYAPVIARHGWTFVDEFFVQHHFARYVSNKYHHPQPFYFFVPVVALLALPWTPFLIAEMFKLRRLNWRAANPVSKLQVFALAWLVVPVLFFSLSGSKLPGYVLPSLPGAALLAGLRVANYLRREGDLYTMRAVGGLLIVSACVVIIYGMRQGEVTRACVLLVTLPLAAAGAFALLWARLRAASLVFIVCGIFVSGVMALNCAVGKLERRETVRELLQEADRRGYHETPVLQLHTIERSAEFYAAGRNLYNSEGEIIKLEAGFQAEQAARSRGGAVLVIVPIEHARQLTEYARVETEVIGDNGSVALVAVRAR